MLRLLCPLDVFQEPLGVFPRLTFFGAIDTQTLRGEVRPLAQGPVVAKGHRASVVPKTVAFFFRPNPKLSHDAIM